MQQKQPRHTNETTALQARSLRALNTHLQQYFNSSEPNTKPAEFTIATVCYNKALLLNG